MKKTKTRIRKLTDRQTAVKMYGQEMVRLVEGIVAHVKEPGEYEQVSLSGIAHSIRDFVADETATLRNALFAAVAEIDEHQREYHHRTAPNKLVFWKQLAVEPGRRRDIPLPDHMKSLQRCTCWAMRGMDDNTYPDSKCTKCSGKGWYIPKG